MDYKEKVSCSYLYKGTQSIDGETSRALLYSNRKNPWIWQIFVKKVKSKR